MEKKQGSAGTLSRVYELTINGKFPTRNEYDKTQRGNKYSGNRMKRDYQKLCEWQIRQQLRNVKICGKVKVHVICYEDSYRRDLDNIGAFFFKVFLDALVRCKVIRNDTTKNVIHLSSTVAYDKRRPRTEVIIEEVR